MVYTPQPRAGGIGGGAWIHESDAFQRVEKKHDNSLF